MDTLPARFSRIRMRRCSFHFPSAFREQVLKVLPVLSGDCTFLGFTNPMGLVSWTRPAFRVHYPNGTR